MSVHVLIPTPLRTLTRGQAQVETEAATIRELIDSLDTQYQGLKERLCDGGDVRRFVNIFVNEEDIRFLQGIETPVKAGDRVSIVPAVAGG